MATFEIRDSLKSYFSDIRIEKAVDALLEQLDGENQPEMEWEEARNYNQALLMAAQVRADHNEMLFDLWDATFGTVLSLPDRRFKIEFESHYCTPDCMWQHGFTWRTMSRHGLQSTLLTAAYELTVMHDDRMIMLSVAKWNAEKDGYQDFVFDPAQVGTGDRWKSVPDDENDVIAKSTAVELTEFFAKPEQHISELQAAAREMVDYLTTIV